MDRDLLSKTMDTWHGLAANEEALHDKSVRLRRCLSSLLPDDTDAATAAFVHDHVGVVALKETWLFVITFDSNAEGLQTVVDRLPLDPATILLRIRDDADGRTPASELAGRPNVPAHTREWTLSWPHGREASFRSVVSRSDGFHQGPDAAERFARELAARIGLNQPS